MRHGPTAALLLTASLIGGCAATTKEIHNHPQQARLERLLAEALPKTKYPNKHYWVRVADPSKDRIGLAVLPQRHIYIAQSIVDEASDAQLRALIVHAVSHHRLHHFNQRGFANVLQKAAFKAGGQFVPGLSNAGHVGGPATEYLMGPTHESRADRKTLVYLQRMGVPVEDYALALELLADRNLAERIGRITSREKALKRRAARVRRRGAHLAKWPHRSQTLTALESAPQ